jgi:hypothetical protein
MSLDRDELRERVREQGLHAKASASAVYLRELLARHLFERKAHVKQPDMTTDSMRASFKQLVKRVVTLGEEAQEEARRSTRSAHRPRSRRAAQATAETRAADLLKKQSEDAAEDLGDAEDVTLESVGNLNRLLVSTDLKRKRATELNEVAHFARFVESVAPGLGLADGECANCGAENTIAALCGACDLISCASCLAEAVRHVSTAQPFLRCFASGCGERLPNGRVAGALVHESPAALEDFFTRGAREQERAAAKRDRVHLIAEMKRRHALPLGDKLIEILNAKWLTCPSCDANVDMYDLADGEVECMHMACQNCNFEMCGFCHRNRTECDSFYCRLNPTPGDEGDNVVTQKRKAVLILKLMRVCEALEGASQAAREAALDAALPAFAATNEEGVGVLTLDEPWGFRECMRTQPAGSDPYMTPMLRNTLHHMLGGRSGSDKPGLKINAIRCGDVLTLTDLVVDDQSVLVNYVTDMMDLPDDEVDSDAFVTRFAGAKGVVRRIGSSNVELVMGLPRECTLVVEWDAVVGWQPAAEVVKAVPGYSPTTGDYVLITPRLRECTEQAPINYGWHPDMQTFAGKWVHLEKRSPTSFSARMQYLLHTFHIDCMTAAAPELSVLGVAI